MAVKDKYKVEQRFISNRKARSRKKLNELRFLVSHETANNTADADDHFTYFENITFQASAHTFIDDKKILNIIPIDEKAWHVRYDQDKRTLDLGYANDYAVGIELCRKGDFEKAYDRYVWYHAYLCKNHGLKPKRHITAHSFEDPERRSDPQSWLEPNGVTWNKFIDDVQNYYDNWSGEAKVSVPSKSKGKSSSTTKSRGYTGSSIVDYLDSIGENSSYSNRQRLARQYGINNYSGTASQNTRLLNAMRDGGKTSSSGSKKQSSGYTGDSIVDYLASIGENSSYSNRQKLAKQYGIRNYRGTSEQNTRLLNLMRGGASTSRSGYKGDSIVDYLNSIGENSSYSNRLKLAGRHGISNYRGTASQNKELLRKIRGY